MGDGEELLPSFIDGLQASWGSPRSNLLKTLAKIPGIYIPALYTPKYSSDDKLIGVIPIDPDIPKSIAKQTWEGNKLSHSTVITPEAAWPNIHMVEVVRSCPELCRFCLASYLTLPFRAPSLESLFPAVEKGLTATNRLGLLGASVTQHPEFMELMNWLNEDCFEGIRLSVSSVRAATVTSKLTKILAKRGSKSITMAIESGSDRIRKVINKKLSEEQILAAAHYAYEGGLKGIKLYGMVGLPSEENSDIEATIKLALLLKKTLPQLRFTLGISTFVPKAHTPFQWHGIRPEAKRRIKLFKKELERNGISIRAESFSWSVIQALLSRSDRRLAPVIASVRGSQQSLGGWKTAYKQARENYQNSEAYAYLNLPPPPSWNEIVNDFWQPSSVLPWTHLEGPIKEDLLIKHHLDAMKIFDEKSPEAK